MTSNALIEKIADLQGQIDSLVAVVAQQDKTIKGMKHYLKVAADYQNDDSDQVMRAMQAALRKASAYEKPVRFPRKRK